MCNNETPTFFSRVAFQFRFDVLVNGGGAVTLQFQRSPFKPLTRTVFVPWNQIVVLPPVVMTLSEEGDSYKSNQPPSPAVGRWRSVDDVIFFFIYKLCQLFGVRRDFMSFVIVGTFGMRSFSTFFGIFFKIDLIFVNKIIVKPFKKKTEVV